jgi:DNA-binding transcriptional MerR regulator
MMSDGKARWSLVELAQESGLSPRTIRYYIARGLLRGPEMAGRGAVYGVEHLDRLRRIRELQSRGAMLSVIARTLGGTQGRDLLPVPEAWERYAIESDVVVWLRADAAPWRSRQLRRALNEFATSIRREGHDGDDGGEA